MRKLLTLGAAGVLAFSTIFVAPVAAHAAVYKDCNTLRKKWIYGLAANGYKDKVTAGRLPITNASVVTAEYNLNKKLDTDKDKVACELPKFKNCTEMNKMYIHGVGKPGAKDKSTGIKVTNFLASTPLYVTNSARDGDKDGIACEKR